MMGRNHLVFNVAVVTAVSSWVVVLSDPDRVPTATADGWISSSSSKLFGVFDASAPSWLTGGPINDAVVWLREWVFPTQDTAFVSILALLLAVLLLSIGTLLPDIDSKSSLLGRFVHVSGPHRGFTHTDWVLITVFAVSLWGPTRLLFWLWLGMALHCSLDGLSTAGRVRFYPLGKYKLIPLSGGTFCVVRDGRHGALYRVGGTGEYVILVVTVALSVTAFVGALFF